MAQLRAYLELVRVPNLFTAAADVLAGYLSVASVLGVFDGQVLSYLLISTVCLYGGGVVLNDYFDEQLDQVERPERPLPSGRISRAAARRFAIGLFVMGALTAAAVGPIPLALALGIALSAAVYDAIGKHTAFGPLNMGLCRFLNLVLGASAVPGLLGERISLALLLAVHVTGVTVLSRGEVSGGQRSATMVMLAALATVVVSMAMLSLAGYFPDQSYLYFLVAFLAVVGPPALRAYREPEARNIGLAVKWGVLGLVLLDAAIAAAYAGPWGGLAVAALLLPSMLIARLFAVT
jgi:4-hydroxybenzoate polyprenyltransferase